MQVYYRNDRRFGLAVWNFVALPGPTENGVFKRLLPHTNARAAPFFQSQPVFAICIQGHPGPGVATRPGLTPAINKLSSGSASDGPGAEHSPQPESASTHAVADRPVGRGNGDCRQSRRRWRLLQYLLGWLEAAAVGGGSGRGGGLASVESEEALGSAVVALVTVSCTGPPAVDQGKFGVGVSHTVVGGRGHQRRFLRPFLVETGQAPCPTTAAEAAAAAAGGRWREYVGENEAVVADGVWGGVLDNLGPSRWRRSDDGVLPRTGRTGGWAEGAAAEVWGLDFGMGRAGGGSDIPAYVGYVAAALEECGEQPKVWKDFVCACLSYGAA